MIDIPDIADCDLSASYNNGEVETKGKVMTIKPTTVSLSFMRYILAKNDEKISFTYPDRTNTTQYNPLVRSDVEGYEYKVSTLRAGYIYIYFENKDWLFKEFETDNKGNLYNIESDLQSEDRNSDEKPLKYYCISKDDVVWVAYSEIQWSCKYIKEIRAKADLRENRMQKFEANTWINSQTFTDAFSVDQIDAYFPLGESDTKPFQLFDGRWTTGLQDDRNNSALLWNWMDYYDNVKAIEEVPDERAEVFFCLHDPLGCADELATELNILWNKMQATINSIHTGIDRNEIFRYILTNKKPLNQYKTDAELNQISNFINSTNMLYQACFSSEDMIDDYGDYLDKERIELILGLKERKIIRDKIVQQRNLLINLLKTDFICNIIVDEFKANDASGLVYGRSKFALYDSFKWSPIKMDAFLNLSKDNEEYVKNDPAYLFINDIFEKNYKLHELFTENTIVDVAEDPVQWAKFILCLSTVMGCSEEFIKRRPDKVIKLVETLNATQLRYGGKVIKVFTTERFTTIAKSSHRSDLTEQLTCINNQSMAKSGRVFDGIDVLEVEQIVFTREFEGLVARKMDVLKKLDNIAHSVGWGKFVQKIAGLNLALSLSGLLGFSKKSTSEQMISLLNITGGIASVFEAHFMLKAANQTMKGTEVTTQATDLLLRTSTRWCAAGFGIGAVVDCTQAVINFSEKDYDAAGAYGVASLCGGLAMTGLIAAPYVGGAIATGSVLAIVASPAVIAVAIVGAIGFGILAAFFLDDDPLERLVKNCVLDDMGGLLSFTLNAKISEIKKGTAAQVVQKHYNNRHYLAEQGFEKWSDFEKLYASVTDILTGSRIDLRREEVSKTTTSWGNRFTDSYATVVYATLKLSMFIDGISNLIMEAYLYPSGFNGEEIPLQYTIDASYKPVDEKIIKKRVIIDIPEKYESTKYPLGFVLFLYRVDLFNNGKYVHPIDLKGKERYIGAKCRINHSSSKISTGVAGMGSVESPDYESLSMLFGLNIKTGTHQELLSYNYWNKK